MKAMLRGAWVAAVMVALSAHHAGAQDADQGWPELADEPSADVLSLPWDDAGTEANLYACAATPSTAASPLSVFVPNLRPGLELTAGLLLLQPGADNLGFATTTTFLPIQNPQWAVQTLSPAYQPGFTVGARYIRPCSGKDIRTTWDHLHTNDSTFVPVSNLNTQWISPFSQTGPSTSESANEVGIFHLKAARGEVAFDYDLVNLDMGQSVNIGTSTQVRLFGGVSWVRLQEQLVSTFFNDPNIDPVPPVVAPANPDLRSIMLNNTSTYYGAGPRLGVTSSHSLPRGFSLVGEVTGAVFGGSMQPAGVAGGVERRHETGHRLQATHGTGIHPHPRVWVQGRRVRQSLLNLRDEHQRASARHRFALDQQHASHAEQLHAQRLVCLVQRAVVAMADPAWL